MRNLSNFVLASILTAVVGLPANVDAKIVNTIQVLVEGDACFSIIGEKPVIASFAKVIGTTPEGGVLVELPEDCMKSIDSSFTNTQDPKPPKPKFTREKATERLNEMTEDLLGRAKEEDKPEILKSQARAQETIDKTSEDELANTLTDKGVDAAEGDQGLDAVMLLATVGCFAAGGGGLCAMIAPIFSGLFGEQITNEEVDAAAQIGKKVALGAPIAGDLSDLELGGDSDWVIGAVDAFEKGDGYASAIVEAGMNGGVIDRQHGEIFKTLINLTEKERVTCKDLLTLSDVQIVAKPSVLKQLRERIAPVADNSNGDVAKCFDLIFTE